MAREEKLLGPDVRALRGVGHMPLQDRAAIVRQLNSSPPRFQSRNSREGTPDIMVVVHALASMGMINIGTTRHRRSLGPAGDPKIGKSSEA